MRNPMRKAIADWRGKQWKGLRARNFEPFTPPDPLDPLGVDEPARVTQQRCNLAIAIASVLASQCDNVGGQPLFVVPAPRRLARCRAMLSKHRTGAALVGIAAACTRGRFINPGDPFAFWWAHLCHASRRMEVTPEDS